MSFLCFFLSDLGVGIFSCTTLEYAFLFGCFVMRARFLMWNSCDWSLIQVNLVHRSTLRG